MAKRSDDILVLDDEANYAEMLVHLLEAEGFSADMRTSPAEALQALRNKAYSLVVSDYKMPEVDGAEFLRRVREIHPQLPVIMVSGFMNTPELLKVANIGVTLVLEKPFETKVFLEHVRRFAEPTAGAAQRSEIKAAPATTAQVTETTFPKGTNLLADASPAARIFLQQLWDGLATGVVAVQSPQGGEITLLLRDAARWTKKQVPAQRIAPAQLRQADKLELDQQLLTVLDARFTARLEDFPALIVKLKQQLGTDTTLIILVPSKEAADAAMLPLAELPPLAGRPEDVAFYAKAMLNTAIRKLSLTPGAVRVLLNYNWPGNYDELYGVMRRCTMLPANTEITAATVEKAIADGRGAVEPGVGNATLEDYLTRRQGEFLVKVSTENPQEGLKTAGVDPSLINKGTPLSLHALLYPDILPGKK